MTTKPTIERIDDPVKLFVEHETVIMRSAAITQELWEGVMEKGMLGE